MLRCNTRSLLPFPHLLFLSPLPPLFLIPSPPLFLSVSPLSNDLCVNASDNGECDEQCNTPQCPFDSEDCKSREYVSGYYSTIVMYRDLTSFIAPLFLLFSFSLLPLSHLSLTSPLVTPSLSPLIFPPFYLFSFFLFTPSLSPLPHLTIGHSPSLTSPSPLYCPLILFLIFSPFYPFPPSSLPPSLF